MKDFTESANTQEVAETAQVETVETTESVNREVATSTEETKPFKNEENAHFAEQRRAREAAETKAATLERDYSIAKTYGADYGVYSESDISEKYGHLGITTLDQFKEAVRIEEMKASGVDVDQYEKYKNEDPDVKAAREWKQGQEQANKSRAEFQEFIEYFKQENGRDYNSATDTIPQEVWDMVNKGKKLTDAYTYNVNKSLKAKIAELEGKKKADETNAANASSSTGSVTGNGSAKDLTLTEEMIENMTPKELAKRWEEVKQLYKMK